MDLLGYQICRNPDCGEPTPDQVAHSTGGLCLDCALGGVNDALSWLQVEVDAGIVTVPTGKKPQTAKNRRKAERRRGSEKVKQRRHASEKARIAAWKRLERAAPELFALIYADERQKRGLTPISVDRALQIKAGELGWATLDAIAFYRALSSPENDPDDAHDPSPDPHEARQGP